MRNNKLLNYCSPQMRWRCRCMAAAMAAQKHGGEELPHVQIRGSSREELPYFQVRSSGSAWLESSEEIPQVQGKRSPSKMVGAERGHQRADRLKPQSQTTSQSVTRTTALSNSMKLSHGMWGHPRWMGRSGEV